MIKYGTFAERGLRVLDPDWSHWAASSRVVQTVGLVFATAMLGWGAETPAQYLLMKWDGVEEIGRQQKETMAMMVAADREELRRWRR